LYTYECGIKSFTMNAHGGNKLQKFET
jgi:hypothetical protein